MSSAELEARLYIDNDPAHKALLARQDESLFETKSSDNKLLTKDQRSKFQGYFIQNELDLNELREGVRKFQSNQAKLIDEITQLSLEIGYITKESAVILPELVKV
jgi:hypothetical protein